jgi:hypothetical protein
VEVAEGSDRAAPRRTNRGGLTISGLPKRGLGQRPGQTHHDVLFDFTLSSIVDLRVGLEPGVDLDAEDKPVPVRVPEDADLDERRSLFMYITACPASRNAVARCSSTSDFMVTPSKSCATNTSECWARTAISDRRDTNRGADQ